MRLCELLQFQEIVIQCHDFPDADTLAAGYGVYQYLRANGKEPTLVYSGKQPISKPNLQHMIDLLEIPVRYTDTLQEPEALVTVDCCYGEGNVTQFPAKHPFVIDHHRFHDACRYPNEIRSSYSSCSTIVAQMLRQEQMDYNADRKLATALYYGLYSDTNGMSEINHPADKDLRDLTDFDVTIITLLKNSNLSLSEMKIAGDALKHYRYNNVHHYAVVEALPCDPNILGFICDLLLQVDEVHTCVVFCRRPFGIKLSVRSCVNDIRANELAEFLVRDYGTGGGHAQKAGGYMRPFAQNINVTQLICERMGDYHRSFSVIYANTYEVDLSQMRQYVKKPIPVGYVCSTALLPAGTQMCIRTLEADLNVCARDSLYIMVGIRGEVYPIEQEKFAHSYTPSDDAFAIRSDYHPSVIDKKAFSSVDLLPFIKTCVPSSVAHIHAKELDRTLKVYTAWDKDNYMLGKPGDFLAVRGDDLHDIYIIERDIFFETYRPCEE